MESARIGWVDVGKGLSILLIVTLHATLGVEKAVGQEGYMSEVVDFAAPFRMPTFFLLAGLLLSRSIDRDWRSYLDAKVAHFAYFYVLWLAISAAIKAPALLSGSLSFLELAGLKAPAGTLWYIYMLPVFFVVTKALRPVPPALLLAAAALLQLSAITTPVVLVQEFAGRYVYFLAGSLAAPAIFRLADGAARRPVLAAIGIGGFALANGLLVEAGLAGSRGLSLLLGLTGAAAMVAFASLLGRIPAASRALGYVGRRSLTVYLAFFIPVVAARLAVTHLLPGLDAGTASVVAVAAGVGGALLLGRLVEGTPARYLFERPAWARLGPRSRASEERLA